MGPLLGQAKHHQTCFLLADPLSPVGALASCGEARACVHVREFTCGGWLPLLLVEKQVCARTCVSLHVHARL